MSKSVAIVTGASQGIGQATAIRLARDFSALVLVARNRANLEQTAEAVKAAGAEALVIDVDLAEPAAAQAVVDQTLGGVRPHRRAAQHRRRGAADRPVRDDRRAVGRRPGAEAARRAAAHDRGVAGAEGGQGLGGADVRQFGAVPEGALCGRRHDQRRDRRAGQGVLRSRHRRRRAGQQRPARPGDDRPPPVLSRSTGRRCTT